MPTLYQIVIVALTSTFTILFADKTHIRYKVRDWCAVKRLNLIVQAIECDFCFSFWIATFVSIVLAIITLDTKWIVVPFLASPLIRFLL